MQAIEAGSRSVRRVCLPALLRTLQAVCLERAAAGQPPSTGCVTASRWLSQLAAATTANIDEGHALVRNVQDYNTFVSMLARRRRCVKASRWVIMPHRAGFRFMMLFPCGPGSVCRLQVPCVCRAYKIRDILEEMHLDGVAPNVDTYFRAMFASMQARRLGDALFYWEDMRKHGIQPDVRSAAALLLPRRRHSLIHQRHCAEQPDARASS